jgi:hypothetical protein
LSDEIRIHIDTGRRVERAHVPRYKNTPPGTEDLAVAACGVYTYPAKVAPGDGDWSCAACARTRLGRAAVALRTTPALP